jgi:hypothetical protein
VTVTENQVDCYICGNRYDRSIPADETAPRLVRYHMLGRWRRVIACWECRETFADKIEEVGAPND